jgi:hypothetical protein
MPTRASRWRWHCERSRLEPTAGGGPRRRGRGRHGRRGPCPHFRRHLGHAGGAVQARPAARAAPQVRHAGRGLLLHHRRQPVPARRGARAGAAGAHGPRHRVGRGAAGQHALDAAPLRRRCRRRHARAASAFDHAAAAAGAGQGGGALVALGFDARHRRAIAGGAIWAAGGADRDAGLVAADRHAGAEPGRRHRRGADGGPRYSCRCLSCRW